MADGYYLSPGDKQTLESVVRWWRGGGPGKTAKPVPFRRPPGKSPRTTVIQGQTTSAVTGDDFLIDNVQVITGSDPRDDDTSTTETVSVENAHEFDADDNALATCIRYDDPDADPPFYCLQINCPA